jgi:hypothetical protein
VSPSARFFASDRGPSIAYPPRIYAAAHFVEWPLDSVPGISTRFTAWHSAAEFCQSATVAGTARKVREKGKTPRFLAREESALGSFSSFPSSKVIGGDL